MASRASRCTSRPRSPIDHSPSARACAPSQEDTNLHDADHLRGVGTYWEHSAGIFKTVDDEDLRFPAGNYVVNGSGTGSDGSTVRFTGGGHFVVDKRQGEVRRTLDFSRCSVS